MTGKRPLRAVAVGETAVPRRRKPLTLLEAVESGDYRLILIAQRREIAMSIPESRGPAKAALHRQLSLIAKELEGLDERAAQEVAVPDGPFDPESV